MKLKYIFTVTLFLITAGFGGVFSQAGSAHRYGKNLIEKYNTLRAAQKLHAVKHDSILDAAAGILLTGKNFKTAGGSYCEDSVRLLLYRSGIIDYQYELREVTDREAAGALSTFLLDDKADNISMGIYRSNGKQLLLKTKSYLKFVYGVVSIHSDTRSRSSRDTSPVKVYTDSVHDYFKILKPNEYYYQFCDHIPSSHENIDNINKEKVLILKSGEKEEYDFIIKSTGKETDMFLIISNKNNERVTLKK